MAAGAQETDQIDRAVQLYVEGCRTGDAAMLREAFHPDSRVWGSLNGARYDVPISDMIAVADGSPVDVDGSFQTQVISIEHTDDAASVVLLGDGYYGNVSFVDHLALARFDGVWKIVNKTFVHTAGELPAAE